MSFRVLVELNPWPAFAIAWLLLFAAHSICVAFLTGAFVTLRMMRQPQMIYYADLLQHGIEPVLIVSELALIVLIILHVLHLVLMLLATCRNRGFQLTSLSAEYKRLVEHIHWPRRSLSQCLRLLDQAWRSICGREGFLGVENPYFEWRVAVAELVKILSLSMQAYNASTKLDSSRWLTAVYVTCVVLNCWSVPIVRHITTRWSSPPVKRLACVLLDAMSNAAVAIALPLAIFVPYSMAFDTTEYAFASELMYNDMWWTNLIYECRQTFPVSFIDLVVKLVPHVCIFVSLRTIGSTIRPQNIKRQRLAHPLTETSPPAHVETHVVIHHQHYEVQRSKHAQVADNLREVTRGKFVDRIFVVWAIALLACHISSNYGIGPSHDLQCKQPLNPWFVRKQACLLYMFNCYHRDTESVQDGDLAFLHRPSLAVLVFAHCPALHIPSAIQQFPNLIGLEVYNSTLVEWSDQAAVSTKTHPVLSYIFIVRTNMSEIPVGMRGPDVPATLMDIEFSVTNLTRVPDDLDVVWPQVGSLYIENSLLQSIPDAVLEMPLYDLSLIGNRIDDMSSVSTVEGDHVTVSLARNPLSTIPLSFQAMTSTGMMLNLVKTHITTVPTWFREVVLTAKTTVYCMHAVLRRAQRRRSVASVRPDRSNHVFAIDRAIGISLPSRRDGAFVASISDCAVHRRDHLSRGRPCGVGTIRDDCGLDRTHSAASATMETVQKKENHDTHA